MMTVWVFRDGELVDKATVQPPQFAKSENLSTPMLSPRFADMESPVTEKVIGSWKARERDMREAGAVDARDVPRGPIEKRRRDRARGDAAPVKWGALDQPDHS
jgi:hypothetical protein